MATRGRAEEGQCTLLEVRHLMAHVQNRAASANINFSWKAKDGIFTAYAKRRGEIMFQKEYSGKPLFDTIIEMHFDFEDFLNSGPFYLMKGPIE